MSLTNLIYEEIQRKPLSKFFQFGLFSAEFRSHMRAKYPDIMPDESMFYSSYLRNHGMDKGDLSMLLLKLVGSRNSIMNTNDDRTDYLLIRKEGTIYSTKTFGGYMRVFLEIDDGYQRFYSKEDAEYKIPLIVRKLVKEGTGMTKEKLMKSVGLEERRANWFKCKVERFEKIGLLEIDGKELRPTTLATETYSPEKLSVWEDLKNWEHRIELVTARYAPIKVRSPRKPINIKRTN